MSSPPPPLPHRGEASSEDFHEFLRNDGEGSKLCRIFFAYEMEKDKKELEAARSTLMEFRSLKESHDRALEGGQVASNN
ncbi:hypothetical protein PIB30_005286 [Stylosanthes scabra]|uniref:Uncharacterized protein n=1 Tax=Stylosanthes scabra TaxID=79078 RepID=A0ABU6U4T3_9FABA|nr:hypothetical protein [Stylosanthes scabra]